MMIKGITGYATFGMVFCAALAAHPALAADPAQGGSSAGLPQLDVSTYPSQIFWLMVTFAALYFIFSKKTLPEISSTLEGRQEHIKNELDQAEKSNVQAEDVQKNYEKNLEKARHDAAEAMNEVQASMAKKAEDAYNKFLEKSEADIRAREKELDKVKTEAMKDMNMIAAEVASEAAQKIVGINTDIKKARNVVESLSGHKSKAKAA